MLHLQPDDPLRLKSFSSSSKGGKALIRIELETENMTELGYALQQLARLQEAQKPPKPKARLALPKP